MPDKGDPDYYVSQPLLLNGVLPVNAKIYPETGKVDVDSTSGGALGIGFYYLDRDGNGNWTLDSGSPRGDVFFYHYNSALKQNGKDEITRDEFNDLVDTKFQEQLNEVSAVSTNNCDNYTSTAMCHARRENHFKNGIAFATNPTTNEKNDANGKPIPNTQAAVDPDNTTPTQPGTDPNNTTPNDDTDPTTPPANWEPYEGVDPIPDYDGTGDPDAGRDLRYPLKHASMYDFIQIYPMKYIPSMGSGGKVAGTDSLSKGASHYFSMVDERYKEEKAGSVIFLPMIPADETTSTGWGEERLNAIQKEFGMAASQAIAGAATSGDLKEWAEGVGGSLMNAANRLLSDQPGLRQFITAHFAGKAVGANLLGRSGVAINPNLELLFSGPALRTFRYSFRFTPREELEAKEIRDIIKVFKKGMAPRRTASHMFLNVPYVWSIKYIWNSSGMNGKQHPYLNKIKTCALRSFNVQYMPDNSYMTYHGSGSMTSYNVTMEFGELEPIYNNDINMTINDMGY